MKNCFIEGEYRPDSLVDIAKLIQKSIITYQQENPDDNMPELAQGYAFGQVMRLGKGRYNPCTIKTLINLERSVYTPATMLQLC